MTPVSEPVFNALSDGTNHFAPYGSLNNHHLIGGNSTESQSEGPLYWFGRLPWRVKRKVPSDRALNTESETDFKSHIPFC